MKSTLGFLGYLTLFSFLLHRTKAVTPVFTDYSPNTIREGLPPGSPYYTFIATDTTPEHNVTYSLESKALEWFNINSTSGVTTVKKTIDREVMGNVYTYKVFASDGTDTAEKTVFQQVLDINDNFPIFSNLPKTVVISEDVCVGSSVFTVTATDADSSPANVIEFDFGAGNEEGRFEFPNVAEGKIILKKPFDYDNGRKQFQLQIIAKNILKAPYLNSTAVLTINVRDVDDLGAKFEKNFYEATAVKDSLLGTVVTIVQAKDQDGLNATVEYNIYQETNPGNTYKVNNNTGEITVNGPLTIGTQMLVVAATSTKHPPTFTVVKIAVTSSNSIVGNQTISTMRPSTITGVKTAVAAIPNNITITEVSAGIILLGFVILVIILALNTFLLGYIVWRGQKKTNYKKIKSAHSKRLRSNYRTDLLRRTTGGVLLRTLASHQGDRVRAPPCSVSYERGDREEGDTSQNVIPAAAEPRNLPGPESVAQQLPIGPDYENVNTKQSHLAPLHTYQALNVPPSRDQTSHDYETLRKYEENSSSSTTI